MIAFFPDVYPDELVYSWLARYGVRSGYSHYRAIADDLFTSNTAKPNLEFIMELSQDAIKAMTSSMSLENIILKHTMFPYYARFLPAERRQKAFRLLINMDKSFNDALYSRRFKTQHRQWLRYCPICAEDDRSRYGETYWHRLHQLDHVDICPAHGCRLHDSTVSITSKASPSLIHAEIVIPESADTTFDNNPIEIKVAQYVSQVFNADIDFANPITHGRFLHHKMEYTKYLSTRGVKRLLTPLYEDFSTYYCDLPNLTITEPWHLEKLFSNYQYHTYDICLLAMFLGIPVSDLTYMMIPENRSISFLPYDYASQFRLTDSRYEKIYEAPVTQMDNSLDKIFVKYNINHPADFKGHSLSMSDIIVTIKDGKKQAFYCDQIGFQPVPGFFTQRTLTQHLGRSIK